MKITELYATPKPRGFQYYLDMFHREVKKSREETEEFLKKGGKWKDTPVVKWCKEYFGE